MQQRRLHIHPPESASVPRGPRRHRHRLRDGGSRHGALRRAPPRHLRHPPRPPHRRRGRRPGAAGRHVALRPGPQGLPRHRPEHAPSKVWFTVADGVLSDVYYPTDRQHQRRDPAVRRHRRLDVHRPADPRHDLHRAGPSTTAACRAGSPARPRAAATRSSPTTSPTRARNSVVMRTTLLARRTARNARASTSGSTATVNGNGGGGDPATQNGGADDAVIDTSHRAPGARLDRHQHRDERGQPRLRASPVYAALRADRPFLAASSGFAGTASDGLAQLDADPRARRTTYATRDAAATSSRPRRSTSAPADPFHPRPRLRHRRRRRRRRPPARSAATEFDRTLPRLPRRLGGVRPAACDRPASPTGLTASAARPSSRRTYYLSANVLKASEDKTFPGAIVAGLASPWGQAVAAGDPAQTVLRLLPRGVRPRPLRDVHRAASPPATSPPRRTPSGSCSSGSSSPTGRCRATAWSTASSRPTRFGIQLDEVAYPILMARTVGLTDKALLHRSTSSGPRTTSSRTARRSATSAGRSRAGYSPSTIAAEIAGLAAAGCDRRAERRRRRRPDLPRHRRPLPAQRSRAGR